MWDPEAIDGVDAGEVATTDPAAIARFCDAARPALASLDQVLATDTEDPAELAAGLSFHPLAALPPHSEPPSRPPDVAAAFRPG